MIHPEARIFRAPTVVFLTTVASALLACGITRAQAPQDFLKQGDEHAAKLESKQALACYLECEKANPKDADLMVKIARQYRHLMVDTSSDSEKLKYGNAAVEYGKKAAACDPQNSDAQLSCALSYGKMLPLMGKRDQVSHSKVIKDGAEKAIKLDKGNDLAWHILGRWHRNVAGMGAVTRTLAAMIYDKLPPASNEEAVDCLEQAIKLNPDRLMHYIELGRTYAQMGKDADAKRCLEKGLSMPCLDKDDPDLKKMGKEVLESIK